jgi:hypothetical protein
MLMSHIIEKQGRNLAAESDAIGYRRRTLTHPLTEQAALKPLSGFHWLALFCVWTPNINT